MNGSNNRCDGCRVDVEFQVEGAVLWVEHFGQIISLCFTLRVCKMDTVVYCLALVVKIHKDLSKSFHMSKQNCISIKVFFFYLGGGNSLFKCSVL